MLFQFFFSVRKGRETIEKMYEVSRIGCESAHNFSLYMPPWRSHSTIRPLEKWYEKWLSA